MSELIKKIEALESPFKDSYVRRAEVIAIIKKHEAQAAFRALKEIADIRRKQ
jgi:hypothetical protein